MKAFIRTLVALAVIPVVILIIWLYSKNSAPAHLTCEGVYSGWDENNDEEISMHVNVSFNGERGEYLMDGKIKTSGNAWSNVRYVEQFTFKYSNGTYYIVSTSIEGLPNNNVSLRSLSTFALPGMTQKGNTDVIEVFKQGDNGYLFTSGRIPIFYCNKAAART